MINSEALEILRKESEFRKNMPPLSPLLENQGADLLTQALDIAISALELLACMEDDGH